MKRLDAVQLFATAVAVIVPLSLGIEATGEDDGLFQVPTVTFDENASASLDALPPQQSTVRNASPSPRAVTGEHVNAKRSLADPALAVDAGFVDSAKVQHLEQSEEEAFTSIRKQLSKNDEAMSSMQLKLNQALEWGHQMEHRLLGSLQTERRQMQKALEAQANKADAAIALAQQREHVAEQQLKSKSVSMQEQAQNLAHMRMELIQKDHDFAMAEQAWRSKAAKLQQDQSAQAQASMRQFKDAQHSRDVELNEFKAERARLVQVANQKIKQSQEEGQQLRELLLKERKDGRDQQSRLRSQLEVKSRDLEESQGREHQLKRQFSTLQKVALEEIQKLRQAVQHRQGRSDAVPLAVGAPLAGRRRPLPRGRQGGHWVA